MHTSYSCENYHVREGFLNCSCILSKRRRVAAYAERIQATDAKIVVAVSVR